MHSVVILQSNWKWNRVRRTKKKKKGEIFLASALYPLCFKYISSMGHQCIYRGLRESRSYFSGALLCFFNCCLTGTHCTVQAASFVCLLTSYDKIPISCFAVGVNVPLFLLYSFFFPFNLFFFLLSFLVYIDSSSNELKILLSWIAPRMYWELTLKFDSSPRHKVSVV